MIFGTNSIISYNHEKLHSKFVEKMVKKLRNHATFRQQSSTKHTIFIWKSFFLCSIKGKHSLRFGTIFIAYIKTMIIFFANYQFKKSFENSRGLFIIAHLIIIEVCKSYIYGTIVSYGCIPAGISLLMKALPRKNPAIVLKIDFPAQIFTAKLTTTLYLGFIR